MTYAGTKDPDPMLAGLWLDLLGIGGVLLVFAGFMVRQVVSGPLVAVNDPYLREGLAHKNYV